MLAQDRDEATLELSLFAEAFQEMLARHYGEHILQALYAERWARFAFPQRLSLKGLNIIVPVCALQTSGAAT